MEDILSKHEKKATLLFEAKRYQQSFDECIKALAIDSKSYKALAYGAINLLNLHKYNECLSYCDLFIANYPENCDPYFIKAKVFFRQGKLNDAEEFTKEALNKKPNVAEYHAFLAEIYHDLGRYKESFEACNESLKHDPENAQALNYKSLALHSLDWRLALEENIKLSLEIHPNDPTINGNIGYIRNSHGAYAEAIPHFKTTLKLNPQSIAAREGMFTALKNKNRFYSFLVVLHDWAMEVVLLKLIVLIIAIAMAFAIPVLMPVLLIFIFILILAIVSEPLMDAFLLFDSDGKHLLSPIQNLNIKINAGILFLLFLELVVYFFFYKVTNLIFVSIATFFLIVPFHKFMNFYRKIEEYTFWFIGTILLFLAVFGGFVNEEFGGIFFVFYSINIFIWIIWGKVSLN